MTHYRHTQIGWMTGLVGAMAPMLVLASVSPLVWGSETAAAVAIGMATVLSVVAALALCSLTVTVDDTFLSIRFGVTPLRKRIDLANIKSFHAVRTTWLDGWGIRYYGSGWLYSVSGFDAIEVHRVYGTQLRVGTDDPQGLVQALSVAVGARSHGPYATPYVVAPARR